MGTLHQIETQQRELTMEISELVKQYEALWENGAPMEQIVGFCRQYSQKQLENKRGETPLLEVLRQSAKWEEMVLTPAFLKHLTVNDDRLLHVIGSYSLRCNHQNIIYYRILSMKKGLPERIRAFWGVMVREVESFCVRRENEILMLVDNAYMRNEIIRNKLSGHELIPAGLSFVKGGLLGWLISEDMREALTRDSVSRFELELTLSGKKITIGLLRRILCEHALNILLHSLKHRLKQVTAILSPQDLLIHICAYEPDSAKAVKALDTLEEICPGISKSTDKLGNTPLWYCLYRSGREELEEALIKYGCDPDARNHLNLSYRICSEAQKLL